MFPHSQVLSVILVAMAGALFHDLANGQPRVPEPTPNAGTPPASAMSVAPATVQTGDTVITGLIAELEAKKQVVEGDTSLEEAVRTQVVQSYGQAIASYQELSRITTEREKLRARIEAAPERIESLRSRC